MKKAVMNKYKGNNEGSSKKVVTEAMVFQVVQEYPMEETKEFATLLGVPRDQVTGHISKLFQGKKILRTKWKPFKYITKTEWNRLDKHKDYVMYPLTWTPRNRKKGIDPKHIKVISIATRLSKESIKKVIELYKELQ